MKNEKQYSPIAKEDLNSLRELVKSFVKKSVHPMLAAEGADGDLSQIPRILAEGRDVGLLASPASEAPGYEFGIWGAKTEETGPEASLMGLEELAERCISIECSIICAPRRRSSGRK